MGGRAQPAVESSHRSRLGGPPAPQLGRQGVEGARTGWTRLQAGLVVQNEMDPTAFAHAQPDATAAFASVRRRPERRRRRRPCPRQRRPPARPLAHLGALVVVSETLPSGRARAGERRKKEGRPARNVRQRSQPLCPLRACHRDSRTRAGGDRRRNCQGCEGCAASGSSI